MVMATKYSGRPRVICPMANTSQFHSETMLDSWSKSTIRDGMTSILALYRWSRTTDVFQSRLSRRPISSNDSDDPALSELCDRVEDTRPLLLDFLSRLLVARIALRTRARSSLCILCTLSTSPSSLVFRLDFRLDFRFRLEEDLEWDRVEEEW